jgi:hypothetical protein
MSFSAGRFLPAVHATTYSATTMAGKARDRDRQPLIVSVRLFSRTIFPNQRESCVFITASPATYGLPQGMGGKST